jgi:hypothetical protein
VQGAGNFKDRNIRSGFFKDQRSSSCENLNLSFCFRFRRPPALTPLAFSSPSKRIQLIRKKISANPPGFLKTFFRAKNILKKIFPAESQGKPGTGYTTIASHTR